MTSQNTSIYTPFSDGHTVRDIVEHTPALVNEAWCRTLLRHTLDSLEQQYASGAPHRPITPDTLVMLGNGETLLLPAGEESPEAEQNLAADLRALALVVHYAITAELPPEGPLGPRLYDNYSDQLTRGLDSCLGPNKRLRPYTVEGMRTLLGIEPGTIEAPAAPVAEMAAPAPVEFVEPLAAIEATPVAEPVTTAPLDPIVISPEAALPPQETAATAPPEPVSLREQAEAGMLRKPANRDPDAVQAPRSFEKIAPAPLHDSGPVPAAPRKPSAGIPPPAPDHARVDAGMQPTRRRNSNAQRWGMIAGAAIVVLAAGGALFSWMQQNDARDVVPLAAPSATGLDAGETVVAAPDATTAPAPAATTQPLEAAPAATGPAPAEVPPPAGTAAQAAVQAAVSADEAIINGTTYKLLIKPWGTVYVDGVDRGVSPPVKRLTLAPGQHTIRIVNPNFPDHVVTVDAGLRESATVQYDFRAQAQ